MEQSTKAVSFATADHALSSVVARVNAELARLAESGIDVDPEHVRYSASTGEHGTRYLGSFAYRQHRPGRWRSSPPSTAAS
jgi:hypothetical protein